MDKVVIKDPTTVWCRPFHNPDDLVGVILGVILIYQCGCWFSAQNAVNLEQWADGGLAVLAIFFVQYSLLVVIPLALGIEYQTILSIIIDTTYITKAAQTFSTYITKDIGVLNHQPGSHTKPVLTV